MSLNITCKICFDNYSSTDQNKKPKVLPCGHTICFGCLKSVNICPLCRKPLPNNKDKIPYNFEVINCLTSGTGETKKEEKIISTDCVVCKEKAVVVCKDCDKTTQIPFCSSCFFKEHSGFLTSKHRKVDINNLCLTCNKICLNCESGHTILEEKDAKRYFDVLCNNTKIEKDNVKSRIDRIKYIKENKEVYINSVIEKLRTEIEKMDFEAPTKYEKVLELQEQAPTIENIQKIIELNMKMNFTSVCCKISRDNFSHMKVIPLKAGDRIESWFQFGKAPFLNLQYYKGIVCIPESGNGLDINWEDGEVWKNIYNNLSAKNRVIRFVDNPEVFGIIIN
jgi:hypothetical protein